MLYDVEVLNDQGTWVTDLTTGSRRYALDRGRYLFVRTNATKVTDSRGQQVSVYA